MYATYRDIPNNNNNNNNNNRPNNHHDDDDDDDDDYDDDDCVPPTVHINILFQVAHKMKCKKKISQKYILNFKMVWCVNIS